LFGPQEVQLSDKVLADLVESFLAALLLDKGLQFAQKFLEVCLFPKLANIIKSSQLVDANTRLHQAVAHKCREEGSKFEMPVYRYAVINLFFTMCLTAVFSE